MNNPCMEPDSVLSASKEERIRRPSVRILCIDTEPQIVDALKGAGLRVVQAEVGYRTGQRRFVFPPHEADLIVCDLRRPACFDSTDWGPNGANDNYRCQITPFDQVSDTYYLRNGKLVPRHQLIQETQLQPVIPGTFGPTDVLRAISEAGVLAVLFLNHEWACRVVKSFPDFVGLRWELRRTIATKIEVARPLCDILPELGSTIHLRLALQDAIVAGPDASSAGHGPRIAVQPIVLNSVRDVFGQLIQWGKGTLLVLPQTQDNAGVVLHLAARVDRLKLFRMEPSVGTRAVVPAATREFREHARSSEEPQDNELLKQGVQKMKAALKIFIGHGHSKVWRDLKDFLSDRLKFDWDEFDREPAAGLSTKERLETMLDNASFAFLVMTAEDENPSGSGTARPRENVIHELGLFQGRLGFERAIILLEEGCAEFSNIHGLIQIRFPKGNIKAVFEEIRRVLEREDIQPGLSLASNISQDRTPLPDFGVPTIVGNIFNKQI